ncbi:MAG: hypothetical protein KF823_16440 [Xanthomonadales bacterium]|nr:hypothetical protein [Xanthomonadales bacterium]
MARPRERAPALGVRLFLVLLLCAIGAAPALAQPDWLEGWGAAPAADLAGARISLFGEWPTSCVPTVAGTRRLGNVLEVSLATGAPVDGLCFSLFHLWDAVVPFPDLPGGTWQVAVIQVPRNPANGGASEVFRFSFQLAPQGTTAPQAVPLLSLPGLLGMVVLVLLAGWYRHRTMPARPGRGPG